MQPQVIYKYNEAPYCSVVLDESCYTNKNLDVSSSPYIDRLSHTCVFGHLKELLERPLFSGFATKRTQTSTNIAEKLKKKSNNPVSTYLTRKKTGYRADDVSGTTVVNEAYVSIQALTFFILLIF